MQILRNWHFMNDVHWSKITNVQLLVRVILVGWLVVMRASDKSF